MFSDVSSLTTRAWIIGDDEMQNTKGVIGEIASGEQFLRIFDLFSGKRPLIYNYKYVALGLNQVYFKPIILCDSNVLSLLTRFVSSPQRLSNDECTVAKALLTKIFVNRLDFSSLFYLVEAFAQSLATNYVFIDRAQETFLRLLTMDAEEFLRSGVIVDSVPLRHSVGDAYGTDNLTEVVRFQTESAKLSPMVTQCEMIYTCLLEMVWIHRATHRIMSIEDKVAMLRNFMSETVGAVSAFVMLLAPEYFANLLNGFISFQGNSNADRQLQRLKAAAWDISLLSMPGILLGEGDQDGAMFAFICTGDKAFASIAQRFQVVSAFASSSSLSNVLYTYDYKLLREQIGSQRLAAMEIDSLTFSRQRQQGPRKASRLSIPEAMEQGEAKLRSIFANKRK